METIHRRTNCPIWSSSKSRIIKVLILGSRSTEANSVIVISGDPRESLEVIEMEEDDDWGEEDIVGLVLSDSLKRIEFVRWRW